MLSFMKIWINLWPKTSMSYYYLRSQKNRVGRLDLKKKIDIIKEIRTTQSLKTCLVQF